MLPLFESMERTLLWKFSHCTFCSHPLAQPQSKLQSQHTEAAAAADVSSEHSPAMESASSAALSAAALSRIFSLTHRHSLTHRLTTAPYQHHQQSATEQHQQHHRSLQKPTLQPNLQTHMTVQQQASCVFIDIAQAAAAAPAPPCSVQSEYPAAAPSGVGPAIADATMQADNQYSLQEGSGDQPHVQDGTATFESQQANVRPRHAASWMLMFINRTLITGCMILVACALPFFG